MQLGEHCIEDKYIIESFDWIVDNPRLKDEELYEYNRSFVASFGLKSDYVGWCTLKGKIDTGLIKRIFDEARNARVKIRGWYSFELSSDFDSEWYVVNGKRLSDSSEALEKDVIYNGETGYYVDSIKAYQIPLGITITDGNVNMLFREDLVQFLSELNVRGINFIWAQDTGRYKAKQFFSAEATHKIPWVFSFNAYETSKGTALKIAGHYGESARLICENSKDLHIELPVEINRKYLQNTDFAEYVHAEYRCLVIRKEIMEKLVSAKLATRDCFSPVLVTDKDRKNSPEYLMPEKIYDNSVLPQGIIENMKEKYAKHLKKEKPERNITEKTALKRLRFIQKENTDFFGKRLSAKNENLLADKRLLPYYKIADGGWLSDEYRYFSIAELEKENADFLNESACENIAIIKNAFLFGQTADGEKIILLPDGEVARYAIGDTDFAMKWKNLPSFFYESTDE